MRPLSISNTDTTIVAYSYKIRTYVLSNLHENKLLNKLSLEFWLGYFRKKNIKI